MESRVTLMITKSNSAFPFSGSAAPFPSRPAGSAGGPLHYHHATIRTRQTSHGHPRRVSVPSRQSPQASWSGDMTKIWTRIAEAAFITIWLGMVAEGLWEIRVLPDPHRVHPGRGRHPPPHRRDPRGGLGELSRRPVPDRETAAGTSGGSGRSPGAAVTPSERSISRRAAGFRGPCRA